MQLLLYCEQKISVGFGVHIGHFLHLGTYNAINDRESHSVTRAV